MFFSLCHIWVNSLWQNSLFLVLSVIFPVIKSGGGVQRGYISIPVLFYIRSFILLHSIKLKSFLSQSAWSNLMTVYLSHLLCAEIGVCSAAHTTHPHLWWDVLWLAVKTAGQGPGMGVPSPPVGRKRPSVSTSPLHFHWILDITSWQQRFHKQIYRLDGSERALWSSVNKYFKIVHQLQLKTA